jgi:hypothetical protein
MLLRNSGCRASAWRNPSVLRETSTFAHSKRTSESAKPSLRLILQISYRQLASPPPFFNVHQDGMINSRRSCMIYQRVTSDWCRV